MPLTVTEKTSSQEIIDYVKKKIDDFCLLEAGWDGEGAEIVNPKSAALAIKDIENSIEEYLKMGLRLINVAPAADGSICFNLHFHDSEKDTGYCLYEDDE